MKDRSAYVWNNLDKFQKRSAITNIDNLNYDDNGEKLILSPHHDDYYYNLMHYIENEDREKYRENKNAINKEGVIAEDVLHVLSKETALNYHA